MLQRLAEVFCGSLATTGPLAFERIAFLGEALGDRLDDICYQFIGFLYRTLRLINERRLDRGPLISKRSKALLWKQVGSMRFRLLSLRRLATLCDVSGREPIT